MSDTFLPMTQTDNNSPEKKTAWGPTLVGWTLLLGWLTFIFLSFVGPVESALVKLLEAHYVFFIGLPIAGLIAYFIVGTLENARGPIEFEALGFKFKGAGGPVIMWVIVFLALVISITLVWDLKLDFGF